MLSQSSNKYTATTGEITNSKTIFNSDAADDKALASNEAPFSCIDAPTDINASRTGDVSSKTVGNCSAKNIWSWRKMAGAVLNRFVVCWINVGIINNAAKIKNRIDTTVIIAVAAIRDRPSASNRSATGSKKYATAAPITKGSNTLPSDHSTMANMTAVIPQYFACSSTGNATGLLLLAL